MDGPPASPDGERAAAFQVHEALAISERGGLLWAMPLKDQKWRGLPPPKKNGVGVFFFTALGVFFF